MARDTGDVLELLNITNVQRGMTTVKRAMASPVVIVGRQCPYTVRDLIVLPMAVSLGVGSEVQRPLATVVWPRLGSVAPARKITLRGICPAVVEPVCRVAPLARGFNSEPGA